MSLFGRHCYFAEGVEEDKDWQILIFSGRQMPRFHDLVSLQQPKLKTGRTQVTLNSTRYRHFCTCKSLIVVCKAAGYQIMNAIP